MGQPSFYHATVALSFQVEICNLNRIKSSFLPTSLLYKNNFHRKIELQGFITHRHYTFFPIVKKKKNQIWAWNRYSHRMRFRHCSILISELVALPSNNNLLVDRDITVPLWLGNPTQLIWGLGFFMRNLSTCINRLKLKPLFNIVVDRFKKF